MTESYSSRLPAHDPEAMARRSAALDIYRRLMEWLEQPIEKSSWELRIPLMGALRPAYNYDFDLSAPDRMLMCRQLIFRRGLTAEGTSYVQAITSTNIVRRIYYAAQWRDFLAIEELLAEEER